MHSIQFSFRVTKCIAVCSIAIMLLLIVLGNTTDYYTNYFFVEHVLKMDTIFPNSQIHYRAINQPILFHAGYILLIILETLMAVSCTLGGFWMIQNIKKPAQEFHGSKKWAVISIAIGILIWFLGFEVIGGEWFGMWQSTTWNGLGSAGRILDFLVLTLLLLHFKEEELT